jgi:membrane protein implicated in regulation of membrane protease activity
MQDRKFVEREVNVEDPQLSPEAERLLTAEVREAVGQDRVRVPADRADSIGRVRGAARPSLWRALSDNRLVVSIAFFVLLIVGVVAALATDSWWAVVAACAVHAIGTLVVITLALRLSTEVEHVAPETAARLEDEGVTDPDGVVSDLAEQYASGGEARGAAEVVSGGHNQITAEPGEDRARATAEQRTALTPASRPTEPAGLKGAPMLLPIIAVGGSVAVALVAAVVLGGDAWLGGVLLVGSGVAWLWLQWRVAGGEEERGDDDAGGPARRPGDSRRGRRTRLVPTMAIVVAAVVAGVIIVGQIAGYL